MCCHHLWSAVNGTLVNTVGLGLDLVGFVLIFLFGVPNTYADHFVWGSDSAKERRHRILSGFGCVLVALGFVLQIVSNYL